ncbi:MAG TPA: hypothetical protein VM734_36475 [Kofleriaceae bacterium]|nr:hypothetical protein [Kofleriaceae bacterium]
MSEPEPSPRGALSPDERDQICATVETLRGELDDLVVRGLRAAGPDDLRTLDGMREELTRIGAAHLAERAGALVDAIRADHGDAAVLLMRAQTSLRVFERVLTLDHVAGLLEAAASAGAEPADQPAVEPGDDEAGDEPDEAPAKGKRRKVAATKKTVAGKTARKPAAKAAAAAPAVAAPRGPVATPRPPPPPLTLDEGKKLLPTLDDLTRAVDGLVATGLTTASEATRQKLDVTMKEALRLKLGRLGAALRFVNEEIGRFLGQDDSFSGRRLAFFLNRAWLVAHGLERAIRAGDAAALGRLLLQPPTVPVARLEVAAVGAGKRIVTSTSSCAFEFRLRAIGDAPPVRADQRLVWSCLFSYGGTFPPEAFLHLPQPQKFLPRIFCERAPIVIEQAAIALDDAGGARLLLGPHSRVTTGTAEPPWAQWRTFDPAAAAARLRAHTPGPLDIEVELQEEVVLDRWEVGEPAPRPGRADQLVYPVRSRGLDFDAVVPVGADGAQLRAALDELRAPKAKRPPLFGLVHYELCRLILQPLAVLEDAGPRHLMIATDAEFDASTLADLTRALMTRR